MTLLSVETKADIRRLHDIWLARLAFEYRCEQSDVLAALDPEAPKPLPDLVHRPAEAKTSAQEPSPDGSGGVQDRCESTPPTHSPERAREKAADAPPAGERPSAAPAPNQDQPIPQLAPLSADPVASEPPHTGSGAAGGDTPPSSPAPKVRKTGTSARIIRCHQEHPDWTARQIADELGIDRQKVSVIVWQKKLPVRKVTAEENSEAHRKLPAARPRAEVPAIAGEEAERTQRRRDISALHRRSPWLTPDQAAARMQMPVANLRIFTQELDIAWSQPRPDAPPAGEPSAHVSQSILARVRKRHEQKPTWTASLLAKDLGLTREMAQAALVQIAEGKTA